MQLLSRRQAPIREELHARDASLESSESGLAVYGHFVDRLNDQPYALLLTKAQLAGRLEYAAGINCLGYLGHGNVPS
jgi:hypothetical protein